MVIGGGLAGPEAAWQLARAGVPVTLYEMRPARSTPAHATAQLGELVCSNSLKSEAPDSAPRLLKQELRAAGSLLLQCADAAAVPGGQALTVDRHLFSAAIEAALAQVPGLELRREEVLRLPDRDFAIVASGPLTAAPLADDLAGRAGSEHLSFYDAISPIVEADSIRRDAAFAASRYGHGGQDYLNCPLTRDEFERFYQALRTADSYPLHAFEEPHFFEACLPLEALARRGAETLRFGPMKPVGLIDPHTGRQPYAVVQLRRENARADSYNLVGFQNHLRWAAQAEVLRLIPALSQARFLRFGQVHRNTYLDGPRTLTSALTLRRQPHLAVAGQLCGTEGYVEAIATGFLAGTMMAQRVLGLAVTPPPRDTALGSLLHYITHGSGRAGARYEPVNMTFDLLPPLPDPPERDRRQRHRRLCGRALEASAMWRSGLPGGATPRLPPPLAACVEARA